MLRQGSVVLRIVLLLILGFLVSQCRFDFINQPKTAKTNQIINIALSVSDNVVPEPNAHKGLLGVLIPQDWEFISAEYNGTLGSGVFSNQANWVDSIEVCYPAESFAKGMKWVALVSDSGYAYEKPIQFNINVKLRTGAQKGCYNLGYLVTKATRGLICSSYTPLSFPHPIGVPDSCQNSSTEQAETAPAWDDLFNRKSGWAGADGIYSIPLSANQLPKIKSDENTLLLFSDTFIGEVDGSGKRSATKLVNNTYALMQGNDPLEQNIEFFWKKETDGSPGTVFVPNTPTSKAGDWYWLMDGVAIGDTVYTYALRLEKGGGIGFKLNGVNLLSYTVDATNGITSYKQIDTPLYLENASDGTNTAFGQALMDLSYASKNPSSDGYIYIYAPKSAGLKKDMLVGRFKPEQISDFSAYRYWDGSQWQADINKAKAVTTFISQEFSVTPLNDGSFIAVFEMKAGVAVRKALSPVGPFEIFQSVYACPEVNEDSDIFVYNAKAHPHLSKPGALLISYNVNTFDFWDHFSNAGIYRPRFVTLKLDHFSDFTASSKHNAQLQPTYPNPAINKTTIPLKINRAGYYRVSIYNILGKEVMRFPKTLYQPGVYSQTWHTTQTNGTPVASGLYIVTLSGSNSTQSQKIIVLK